MDSFLPKFTNSSELDPQASATLKEKYKRLKNIKVYVLELDSPLFEPEIQFTRIIANPPYGAYQSHQRTVLKKRYPGLYVRDTYGVILYHCFRLLGRALFIIIRFYGFIATNEDLTE